MGFLIAFYKCGCIGKKIADMYSSGVDWLDESGQLFQVVKLFHAVSIQ